MTSQTRPQIADSSDALVPLNENVLKVLVENHRKFSAFLANRVDNKDRAEDLLQQALQRAVEQPPTSQDDLGILAWFYQVLRNILVDDHRRQESAKRREQQFAAELDLSDDEKNEVCACLYDLLPTLNSSYADLLRRVDLQGEAIDHVSRDLGLNRNNLNVKLHRARQALKTSLLRACGTCTTHGCLNCTCKDS